MRPSAFPVGKELRQDRIQSLDLDGDALGVRAKPSLGTRAATLSHALK
jgi:hypothetical protein